MPCPHQRVHRYDDPAFPYVFCSFCSSLDLIQTSTEPDTLIMAVCNPKLVSPEQVRQHGLESVPLLLLYSYTFFTFNIAHLVLLDSF
jgi:hypothetical protein